MYAECFPWLVFNFGRIRSRGSEVMIPLAFFALLCKNELQCHCLNVCINSGDDVAISCKNLVNLCQVTAEIMELIWERQVWQGQKTGVFRWISPDILDRFSQYFHHMKALYVQMMDICTLFSNLSRDVAMTINQIMLPWWRQTDATCILCTFARC